MKIRHFLSCLIMVLVLSAGMIVTTDPAPRGHTGSPVDGKDCSSCHSGSRVVTGNAILEGLPEVVIPGRVYNLTMKTSSNYKFRDRYPNTGFQMMAVDADGNNSGVFRVTEDIVLQEGRNGYQYVTHKSVLRFGQRVKERSWDINWIAPRKEGGSVNFYFSSVIGDNHNDQKRDRVISKMEEAPIYQQMEGEIDVVKGLDCADSKNGSIKADVEFGLSPYRYQWSTGATSVNISDLGPGNYSVIVTDLTGEKLNLEIELTVPEPLAVSMEAESPSCHNSSDATIDITPEGGTMPYSFEWNTGSDEEDLIGIEAGTYQLSLTDANQCLVSETIQLNAPSEITITPRITHPSCNGQDDGSVAITVSGGEGPYSYAWSHGSDQKDTKNLSPGTYQLTVTDDAGCTTDTEVMITEPEAFSYDLIHSDETEKDAGDGFIKISNLQGTGPWSFSWSTGEKSDSIGGLAPGDYSLTITDALGCSQSDMVTIMAATATSVLHKDIDDFINLYPNPFSDYIYLEKKHPGLDAKISIFNIEGTPLYKQRYSLSSNKIWLGFLPHGIYFMTLTGENWIAYRKLIK